MDSEDQSSSASQGSNPQPEPALPQEQLGNSTGGMKIIQPLSNDIKPDEPAPPPPQPHTQPEPTNPQPPTPYQPQPAVPPQPPAPPRPDIRSIYPEATKGIATAGQAPPPPSPDGGGEVNSHSFSEGYVLGGSIFWRQLIAGIVMGVVYYVISYAALKTASYTVVDIIALIYSVIALAVEIYIPYNILQSNDVQEPGWFTVFGIATQSFIIGVLFAVIDFLIISAINHHVHTTAAVHLGVSGIAAAAIIVYVVFFIVCYFLTKLSWGIAFSQFGRIKNKNALRVAGIAVIVIFIGLLAFRDLHHV